jgi:hypothetical protein
LVSAVCRNGCNFDCFLDPPIIVKSLLLFALAVRHGHTSSSQCAWDVGCCLLVDSGEFSSSPYQYLHHIAYCMYQLIPQIIINYRRHNAIGLQPTMMMLWAWAGVPLGVYNIAEGFNIALRIQPQILTLLSLVTWIQCFYYERVPLPQSVV